MTRNQKIIIIAAVLVVIFAAVAIYLFVFNNKEVAPDPNEKVILTPSENIQAGDIEIPKFDREPPSKKEVQTATAQVTSKMFVERFGTFTNQSEFNSLEDLYVMMTPLMSGWVKTDYLPGLRSDYPADGEFYRMVTLALTAEIVNETVAQTDVMVSTQRTKTVGKNDPEKFNQDIKIELIKQGDNWLVDGAFWQ
ncbi:hypothetical protein HN958_02270 [Candidatus Falkowbacteria bacterium]|mgnify:CR=1 FL=1|jgi:hypothetical protein|nr:hypothetical protein [Candidatus Falkowbacteria bacterium]MBT7007309.1 hypothetical protein [Candidatus Falkowbacteria bacterium]